MPNKRLPKTGKDLLDVKRNATGRKKVLKRLPEKDLLKARPEHIAFAVRYVMNGGNAGAAARSLGLREQQGRRWVIDNPVVLAAIAEYQRTATDVLQDFEVLSRRAIQTMVDLLDSDSDMVRLGAARELVNRAMGLPTVKVEQKVIHEDGLSEVQMQCVLSLMAQKRMTLEEAKSWVLSHPDEVRAWASRQLVAGGASGESEGTKGGEGAKRHSQLPEPRAREEEGEILDAEWDEVE